MRLAAGALMTLLLAAPAGAAPIVRVIEDFEGDAPAPHSDARIVEVDGDRVLRWEPSDDEPYFLNFDYGGRDVEMAEWDRLVFRYRIEAEQADWWGVKIIDHPLGEGYQVPYRIPREEVVTGEWAEARLSLHPVTDRWGDRASETRQTIVFRASGVRGERPAFLIDDIRVVRDALTIDAEPAGSPRPEGDRWRRDFAISLTSRHDRPLAVRFEAEQTAGAHIDAPAPFELQPGETVRLAATLTAPADLAPLTTLAATIVALSDDDDRAQEELAMSIPLGEIEHPCLLLSASDVPRILERIEAHDWAREAWASIKAQADGWLDREIELPDRGGQWYHWYTCEKCGGGLRTESPTRHVCKICGATYSGWPYDDVVIMREHNSLSRAVRHLGLAYALTGERAYAGKAREILLAYAAAYLDYPPHNKNGEAGGGACHVAAQPLSEATWLIPIVQGFDCIFDTLSAGDRQVIADRLLLPAAELVRGYARSIHNIPCWENSAYGLVGIAVGDEDLAAQAINGRFGLRNQVAEGVNDDGMWYEGSWGYHYYTMSALEPLVVAAEHVGIDLYSERYLSMFLAPIRMMAPNGALPAFNDSSRTSALARGDLYENAMAHWRAPELAVVLGRSNRRSMEALLFGPDQVPRGTSDLSSHVFESAGVAVLRTDADERPDGLIEGVPANYLALDYGPHGSGHGHPDKLGFEMYALGALVATDAGSVQYGNPAHRGWYRQTLSHNTVVVDGASQQPTEGRLLFAAFGDGMAMVAAESDGAYEGVTLQRVMALLPDALLDITLALSDDAHRYDWALHCRGDLQVNRSAVPLHEPPGEGAYRWAEKWHTAGPVPGWEGAWTVTEELTVHAAQATSAPAELMTAIGRGNPASARDPFVLSRVRGADDAAWATALSWGEAPGAVRLLHGARDGETLPLDDAAGLEVTVGGRRLLLLYAERGASFEQVSLDGRGALLLFDGDAPESWLVADGAALRVNGAELELP